MAAVLEIAGVSKAYGALRPLRLRQLAVGAGESVAIVGLDQGAAEIFVNLITGATLPDAGEIRVFGRATAAIADSADWLATVDRFGIVSDRAVLLEQLSVVQNLAMPFTLDVEPPADDVRARAIALAVEVGLTESSLDRPVSELDASGLLRARLARAVALDPAVVLFEHPTAGVARADVAEAAARCRAVTEKRSIAAVVLTADHEYAAAAASRVLTWDPASGRLRSGGWFSRLRGA